MELFNAFFLSIVFTKIKVDYYASDIVCQKRETKQCMYIKQL